MQRKQCIDTATAALPVLRNHGCAEDAAELQVGSQKSYTLYAAVLVDVDLIV